MCLDLLFRTTAHDVKSGAFIQFAKVNFMIGAWGFACCADSIYLPLLSGPLLFVVGSSNYYI